MKSLKYFFALSLIISISSCKKEVKPINIEVAITGMTCEIGCAKLIESKTYRLEGVTYSKVSFEYKTGQFSFDSNKISISDVEKHINGIAGGELYKVTKTTVVEQFSDIGTK